MTEQNSTPNVRDTPGEGLETPGYRRLPRAVEGRFLFGVCSGLGRYTGIDPVIFRVAFALLLFAGGQGALLYIAAALLMPADATSASPAERVFRRRFDGAAVLTIMAGLLAACAVFTITGSGFGGRGMPQGALTIVVIFTLVLLAAHARNVDLGRAARSLPERLQGHPLDGTGAAGHVDFAKTRPAPDPAGPLPAGMIDLATLNAPGTEQAAEPSPDVEARPPAAAPAPAARAAAPRPRSAVTPVTLLAALVVGAVMVPVAAPYGMAADWQIVLASALAVVGGGLVVSGWFGRARGLATVGTVLTLSLVATSAVAEVPKEGRFGDVLWRPTDVPVSGQTYRVVVGNGTLDLSSIPLAAGQRLTVRGELGLGEMHVTVPPAARVELDARAGLGDVTVDGRITGGPNAKVVEVLEPTPAARRGAEGDPPVIALQIRSKVGDVDVTRHG